LGLFAGVIADRFDNRRTVIVTQGVQMAFSAVLAAVTLFGAVRPWEVYAIALNSSLFNLARIVGPALAGLVIAAVGSGWCFAINSASFLAVLAGLLAMRTGELYA